MHLKKQKTKGSFNSFALSSFAFIYLIFTEYCLCRFCFTFVPNAFFKGWRWGNIARHKGREMKVNWLFNCVVNGMRRSFYRVWSGYMGWPLQRDTESYAVSLSRIWVHLTRFHMKIMLPINTPLFIYPSLDSNTLIPMYTLPCSI